MSALAQSRSAVRAVFTNPSLRRLQLAWLGSVAGDYAYSVALSVYAYGVGGPAAVGLVLFLRMLPSAVGAPFVALLGDRYPRERVILGGNLALAVLSGATALAVGGEMPAAVTYALAIAFTIVATAFWPAQAALLPSLARGPAELTAANTTSTTLEGFGSFIGPALCGLLLAGTSVEFALAATAAVFLAAALPAGRIRPPAAASSGHALGAPGELVEGVFAGFAAVVRARGLRVLVVFYGVWALAEGALEVLIVVLAFDLLDLGGGGVGLLTSAVGVGGIIGALVALAFAGRRQLSYYLAGGTIGFGVPLCLLALSPNLAAALLLLAALGAASVVIDVTSLTLLQRTAPDPVLMRVLGVVEGLWVASIGIGAIVAPALISLWGVRGALAVVGVALPLFGIVGWRWLRALDESAPSVEVLALLRSVPFLAPLPAPALGRLAGRVAHLRVPLGAVVFRQGDPADRFYIVADGRAEVAVDGRAVSTVGPGGFFGEIAILREISRTGTVSAVTELELFALERDDFLSVVTGSPEGAAAADAFVRMRLAGPGITTRAV